MADHLRLVPPDPDATFTPRPWPCDARPRECGTCVLKLCPYNVPLEPRGLPITNEAPEAA